MTSSNAQCVLGITMGDPAGSGPEIVIKALALEEMYEISRPVVIGDLAAMQAAAEICGLGVEVRPLSEKTIGAAGGEFGLIEVLDLHNVDLGDLVRGRVDPMAGNAAYEYIVKAARLALAGQIDAIVTSAINKDALNKAGHYYDGHTELLAHLCAVKHVTMMLVGGGLRVTHVSTHCSLREAIDRVKRERILTVVELTRDALLRLGIKQPRIAVAGLNPHAGEGGMFGNEEIEEIEPAVKQAQAMGLDVSGPFLLRRSSSARSRARTCGCRHVSRPGPHSAEDVRLPRGCECHPGAANHPHVGRPRHQFRQSRQGHGESPESRRSYSLGGAHVPLVAPVSLDATGASHPNGLRSGLPVLPERGDRECGPVAGVPSL